MTTATTTTPDVGERLGRWLGDLDHPFYDDERNRWIWYEASAIGFQTALIGSFLAAGLTILIGGSDLIAWVLVMMMPTTIAALFATGFISRRGADYAPSMWDMRRSRGLAVVGVVLFLMAAMVIRGIIDSNWFVALLPIPLLIGGVAGVAGSMLRRKSTDATIAAIED